MTWHNLDTLMVVPPSAIGRSFALDTKQVWSGKPHSARWMPIVHGWKLRTVVWSYLTADRMASGSIFA